MKKYFLFPLLLISFYCSALDLENKVVFFTGYPGSGKGTQGKIIADKLNMVHLSTGELFRSEAKRKTPIGLEMEQYMNRGEIIPKEIVFNYLRQELANPKYRSGIILDGYPKDEESFNFIISTLKELQYEPYLAFFFDLSREEVLKRLTGRLHCKHCEKDYHIFFDPPKVENICDQCGGLIEKRDDDSEITINKRLDVFEAKTTPLLEKFSALKILYPIDASLSKDQVTSTLLNTLETKYENQIHNEGPYFLRLPKDDKSLIFHNHIDAESHLLLRSIIKEIESNSLDFQNKIYPISDLLLGSQILDPVFAHVYQNLPNFHSIHNSKNEAFSTGKMGDHDFNYDQIKCTLEVTSKYSNQGVMTELEEDLFEKTFDEFGKSEIILDRGDSIYQIDWDKLPGWENQMINNLPAYELHHGFDIPKNLNEDKEPIDLVLLNDITSQNGFNTGGWFIFRKNSHWAYRCNEFSNDSYEACLEKVNSQAEKLENIIKSFLGDRPFTHSCSLEKVHAMWHF